MRENESSVTVERSLPDHRRLGFACKVKGCTWGLHVGYPFWLALKMYNKHADIHSPMGYGQGMLQIYSKFPEPPKLPVINYTYGNNLWESVREDYEEK